MDFKKMDELRDPNVEAAEKAVKNIKEIIATLPNKQSHELVHWLTLLLRHIHVYAQILGSCEEKISKEKIQEEESQLDSFVNAFIG